MIIGLRRPRVSAGRRPTTAPKSPAIVGKCNCRQRGGVIVAGGAPLQDSDPAFPGMGRENRRPDLQPEDR
jgi:hypothetical protein